MKCLIVLFTGILFHSCQSSVSKQKPSLPAEEKHRPVFHFSPQKGWMNDPNGLVFYKGTYHLFFQYYPDAIVWGPMHWGHAVSSDLVHWKELPIAIYPDELGFIFSGSAVADLHNTSGLGTPQKPPLVAMFTHHDMHQQLTERMLWNREKPKDIERQSLAFSLDEGKTWTKYTHNPVIQNPGISDFRDPKLYWSKQHQLWIVALAAQDKIMFYTSKDMISWKFLSDFGKHIGAHHGVWECPDFFPLRVKGTDEVKWVLIVNINPGAYNGGSGTQYFIGDFDGKKFTVDKNFQAEVDQHQSLWLDYGKDNYASVSWSNTDHEEDHRFIIGMMSNWDYAQNVPTSPWRTAMTIPRELHLQRIAAKSYRLSQMPVETLRKLRTNMFEKKHVEQLPNIAIDKLHRFALSTSEISFDMDAKRSFVITLSNGKNEKTVLAYSPVERMFTIDRSSSGEINFSPHFGKLISKAPRFSNADTLHVHMLIDKASVEVFYDQGITVMTETFFPTEPYTYLSIQTEGKTTSIDNLTIHELKKE